MQYFLSICLKKDMELVHKNQETWIMSDPFVFNLVYLSSLKAKILYLTMKIIKCCVCFMLCKGSRVIMVTMTL